MTHGAFFQDAPRVGDPWADDAALQAALRRLLPADVLATATPELARLGARAGGDLLALADAAEAAPPRHVPYDAWGRRVDRIEVSDAWRALDRASAEEGMVAVAYERPWGAASRVVQMAMLHLFHPSSAIYSCPLAMTDGAARCLSLMAGDDAVLRDALAHLTSRDPAAFWTSGQWMTERTGGSDVSMTGTRAEPADDGAWRLHGTKWFTSATTSQMTMTLARLPGAPDGSRGLSLFFVPLARDAEGRLPGLVVHRLKEKLGTHALPTAELTLDGTPARLVGGAGEGVRRIATLFNVTRVWNAACAAGGMRRAVTLARDYASRRVAFGKLLRDHPLHAETLAAMEVEARGALQLVLHVAALLGREECGLASDGERAALRLLTPVAKLFTGKQAVAVASEALEAFGGAGYVEDTGLPRLLRDAQVLAIWEGTTNVLALDVLRAIEREDALAPHLADLQERLRALPASDALAPSVAVVGAALGQLGAHAAALAAAPRADVEAGARSFAIALGRATIGVLLLEQAAWSATDPAGACDAAAASAAARRWCATLPPPVAFAAEQRAEADALLGRVPVTG
ncbi:acyl-CoA dehydrogenase family protein [Roseisolibacter agri]|uniref:acyl-CoA dehydrogenase family protein n=1 Tax=Roseisolibacter agri TaxID=2014610 RepID=UPI0024E143B4|nr:acyl-CoA dehydrogenase family protein [Roseisolibacter agri]